MRNLAVAAAVVLCACSGGPAVPMPKGDGESCMKPFRLTGTTVDQGFTSTGFTDDEGPERSACGGGGAPDVVFELGAPTGAVITVTVTPNETFQPIVKVRSADRGCVDLDEACDSATGKGEVAEIKDWAPALGGRHYVIVDGAAQTSGPFRLKVTQR